MNDIILFITTVFLTESITDIISKSAIFSPFREFFFNRRSNKVFKFIHDLLDCGYCLSVWIGTILSLIILNIHIVHPVVDWFFTGLLVHRASNILHNVIDRTRHDINF